jgi:xanthine dehydrogenase YagR molybdenum-binding subunit
MPRDLKVVGKSTPRIDALERVTGQARYTEDVYLPGMLFARVLRSPHPHARVRSIDTSAAEALPGVMAILDHRSDNTIWGPGDTQGRRLLFTDTVRFVGDSVAAVAAVDRHVAEDALHLIRVDYEELPFVVSVDDALREDAPKIFPEGNVVRGAPSVQEGGNIEEGFRQADLIFEQEIVSKHLNNAQLERRVSVAQWDGDRLTVWAAAAGIYNCRRDIAANLKLPLNKVRVICQYMGGAFGNKNQCYDFDLMAALLAKRTGRPVRLEFTRPEDFIAVHGRWSTRQQFRIGAKKDGTITALEMKGTSGIGGYLRRAGGMDVMQAYAFPNYRTTNTGVHTNTSCGANFRAPSGPQGAFGIETAMDEIAERLQMDPVEIRLKNIVTDVWVRNKTALSSNAMAECIRRGAEAIGWAEKRRQYAQQQGPVRRGVGVGLGTWDADLGASSAVIKLFPDGSIKVHVGVTDVGTGAKTTMGVIAAEALGVPFEAISIVSGDTDLAPYSPGESSSATTGNTGWAVIEAAKQIREQLFAQAASRLKVPRENLDLRDGKIVNTVSPDQSWNISEATSRNVDALTAAVTATPEDGDKARHVFAAHFAEVEVNMETGKVRVLRYVAAHDSGTIINRLTAGSQVKGGVVQGIGMALREELIWDRNTGIPVNNHYHGAKALIHPEAPDVEVIFIEPEEAYGPFGAKTLGEIPIVPVVGCIANAIYHATGARMRELPITPDKLLMAFRNGAARA